MPNIHKHLEMPPIKHPEVWDNDDRTQLQKVLDLMNRHELPQTWLAAHSGVSPQMVNRIFKGTYPAPVKSHIERMLTSINAHLERKSVAELPFIESSVYKLFLAVCKFASTQRKMTALSGLPGIGKTRSAKEYTKINPNAILVEPSPTMSQGALIEKLVTKTKAKVKGSGYITAEQKFDAVIDALKGTDKILLVDEANTISKTAIETIRRIKDLANIGIVLIGTDALYSVIHSKSWQFDQVRNRITLWPETIEKTTPEDCEAMVNACFTEHDILPEVLERLWDYHAGNMRVLTESLIPAIRDFGLAQGHELSIPLVDKIAKSVLSMTPAESQV